MGCAASTSLPSQAQPRSVSRTPTDAEPTSTGAEHEARLVALTRERDQLAAAESETVVELQQRHSAVQAEKEALARTTGTGTDNHWVVIKSDNTSHGMETRKLERVQVIATMAIVKEQDDIQRERRTQATKEKKV